ncbi:MAG: hypothetical protein ACKVK6_06160 [bacterium]|jgi:hypothetical protein
MRHADSTFLPRSIFFLVSLIATFALSTSSIAQETPSDALAPLASEFTKTIDRALAVIRGAAPQETAMHQRTRDAAVEMLKDLRAMAAAYESRVKQSDAIMDTDFFFQSLKAGANATRATARDAVPDPRVAVHLNHLNKLLVQLSAVYATAR